MVWWLCWHRTILMKNIRQKQYSQFPPVHDFGKTWWGVAYVPFVNNLRACLGDLVACDRQCCYWMNTGMVNGRCPIMFVHTQSYPCDTWYVCSPLPELAVSNLGQLLFCLSIMRSRCRNAYPNLWLLTIGAWLTGAMNSLISDMLQVKDMT